MNSFTLSSGQRATHTYVIGQPGTGESRALESWIMQDIHARRGVGVIDPHGDLFQGLISRLAFRPGIWDRVILFDPCNPKWVIGINPLVNIPGLPLERTALFTTDVVMKIWRINPESAPRMLWLLNNTLLALADLKLSL